MIVIGENLLELAYENNIVSHPSREHIKNCIDETCIQLTISKDIVRLVPTETNRMLTYGENIPEGCILKEEIGNSGLIIEPQKSVLACSEEKIHIPRGYMGFLQTKGSLARLFVSIHFSDAQIDAGYKGRVTFEIFNGSDFDICIKRGSFVANLYIIKASTKNHEPYQGRYLDAETPTIQVPLYDTGN